MLSELLLSLAIVLLVINTFTLIVFPLNVAVNLKKKKEIFDKV